jgi:hypothetical protein
MKIKIGKYEILIDRNDYVKIKNRHYIGHKRFNSQIYFQRPIKVNGKWTTAMLHREIINCPKGKFVDHVNCNTLDNRKNNLRICSFKENIRNVKIRKDNKSGYKGVYFKKKNRKWCAQIHADGNQIYLGLFNNPGSAHEAYKKRALKYFKEFARMT